MTLLVFAQQLILACTIFSFTSFEKSNVYFYPKTKSTNRLNNKHAPAAPIASLHANITTDNEVVLSFEDDTFSDIDVTIAYGDTIIYCDHYAHKEGSTISIPLAIIDDQDSYVITIKKGTVEYTAQFSF